MRLRVRVHIFMWSIVLFCLVPATFHLRTGVVPIVLSTGVLESRVYKGLQNFVHMKVFTPLCSMKATPGQAPVLRGNREERGIKKTIWGGYIWGIPP